MRNAREMDAQIPVAVRENGWMRDMRREMFVLDQLLLVAGILRSDSKVLRGDVQKLFAEGDGLLQLSYSIESMASALDSIAKILAVEVFDLGLESLGSISQGCEQHKLEGQDIHGS